MSGPRLPQSPSGITHEATVLQQLFGGCDTRSPFLEENPAFTQLASPTEVGRELAQSEAIYGLIAGCRPQELLAAIVQHLGRFESAQSQDALAQRSWDTLRWIDSQKPLSIKHCLAIGRLATGQEYRVHLHHYLPEAWDPERTEGKYVEQWHNHRFALFSMILAGGYTADERRLADPSQDLPDRRSMVDGWKEKWTRFIQGLKPKEIKQYKAGDMYSMRSPEIHRLREFMPGTISLLVEIAASDGDYSVGFDDNGQEAILILPDNTRKLEALMAAVARQSQELTDSDA